MLDKNKGAYCELLASAWLLNQGYEVYRNVSQHGAADLVAIAPDEVVLKIDVKKQSRPKFSEEKYKYCVYTKDSIYVQRLKAKGLKVLVVDLENNSCEFL